MIDKIDENEIRKAIDRLQLEHPVHFAYDATRIVEPGMAKAVQDEIDRVAKSMDKDATIHIICEMAKLYLDGVKPTTEPKRLHGEWRFTDGRWGLGDWECTLCHNFAHSMYDFCPNCGADMRRSEEK